MIVWFVAIGACGIDGIADHPRDPEGALADLRARVPVRALLDRRSSRWPRVVLAITGAEALYADMGHFGRAPITRAWLVLVFPACILSYMGQGALVLGEPDSAIIAARSSCSCRTGAGCRWSCWPPRRR